MKKILMTFLLLVWVLSLAGCGTKDLVKENWELQAKLYQCQEEVERTNLALNDCDDQVSKLMDELSESIIETGVIETGVIETGDISVANTGVVDTDADWDSIDDLYLMFPEQPKHINGNWYKENTEQLNKFAKDNMQEIFVKEDATSLVISSKFDIPKGKSVVLYIDVVGEKRHCGGNIEMAYNWPINSFDLSQMDLRETSCDWDRTKKINWKTVRIGWYINTYDWNHIEKIWFE